jgi:hypothetical protein
VKTLREHYRRLRRERPEVPACCVLVWARDEVKIDAVNREIEWEESSADCVGTLDDGIELWVYWDEEVYDWGDIEPTDYERENLQVIGVGVRLPGDEDDLDTIWGVGWTDGSAATTEAVRTAVSYGFIDRARNELAERERLAGYVETV